MVLDADEIPNQAVPTPGVRSLLPVTPNWGMRSHRGLQARGPRGQLQRLPEEVAPVDYSGVEQLGSRGTQYATSLSNVGPAAPMRMLVLTNFNVCQMHQHPPPSSVPSTSAMSPRTKMNFRLNSNPGGGRRGWWDENAWKESSCSLDFVHGSVFHHRTLLLLNSGASTSIISLDLARRLKLRMEPRGELLLNGIDGVKAKVTNKCRVKITLGHLVVCTLDIWVGIIGHGIDVLLGMNFMVVAGVRLLWLAPGDSKYIPIQTSELDHGRVDQWGVLGDSSDFQPETGHGRCPGGKYVSEIGASRSESQGSYPHGSGSVAFEDQLRTSWLLPVGGTGWHPLGGSTDISDPDPCSKADLGDLDRCSRSPRDPSVLADSGTSGNKQPAKRVPDPGTGKIPSLVTSRPHPLQCLVITISGERPEPNHSNPQASGMGPLGHQAQVSSGGESTSGLESSRESARKSPVPAPKDAQVALPRSFVIVVMAGESLDAKPAVYYHQGLDFVLLDMLKTQLVYLTDLSDLRPTSKGLSSASPENRTPKRRTSSGQFSGNTE
ncbi:LOW QUALITY PROTEIN: hypothetical protein PHMEG_0002395 [Phytophthora megakarya]|uniref:Peptidase A2 domain-containing protein n=1 Tax=Phytophthora megakarya TaxID=4795 RepID=A0A225WYU0_9STRA|nr:LOW QUALITY PROTEIN: hypothetical protein PHMEG_0002395 [Phytophthora megakarya]